MQEANSGSRVGGNGRRQVGVARTPEVPVMVVEDGDETSAKRHPNDEAYGDKHVTRNNH